MRCDLARQTALKRMLVDSAAKVSGETSLPVFRVAKNVSFAKSNTLQTA